MQRPNYPSGKDLLSADAVSRFDLDDIIARAERHLRAEEMEKAGLPAPEEPPSPRRRPKVIATLFDQRSTRTRLGFQSAAARLGHQSIDAYDTDRSRMGSSTGESIEDHIHTVELYSDLLVVRSHREDMPYRVGRLSYLPVINAGNGADEHPTQALIDIFAIRQMRGELETLSIALSSDTRARFAVSFVKMLSLSPPKRFTLCCLPGVPINPPMREAMTILANSGSTVGVVHDVRQTLDHDVLSIQMQDMSRFAHASLGSEAIDKERESEPFTLTARKILDARSDTLILNPLPRFSELDTSCDDLPNAGYFRQVQLSVPMRMAILERMLSGIPWTGQTDAFRVPSGA
ncbi:Aspartate carbamoyltransferase [Hyphomicrobiales bacterium]|nr:Aspartate carbamoyltransferase [Hyphomicrobiales bacterium]CAH1700380.1 Aspartate carbamoyltransferase [Hyphomicrobiales bacterium]CAI0344261.1 Aspartate transcarbamylase [Hyphomicrobiales bacterium]